MWLISSGKGTTDNGEGMKMSLLDGDYEKKESGSVEEGRKWFVRLREENWSFVLRVWQKGDLKKTGEERGWQ